MFFFFLRVISIFFLFLLFSFISLPSQFKLFAFSCFIIVVISLSLLFYLLCLGPLILFLIGLIGHTPFIILYLINFPIFIFYVIIFFSPFIKFFFFSVWAILIDSFGLDLLHSFSVDFNFPTLTSLSFSFCFSLFNPIEFFNFDLLGGVAESESSPILDLTIRVYEIGNCLGLEGSFSSPPSSPTNNGLPAYSSLTPFDETSSGPPAYSPPTSSPDPSSLTSPALVPVNPSSLTSPALVPVNPSSSTSTALVPVNPSSSTSTALVPVEPLPIWLACPDPSKPFFTVPVGDFTMFDSPFTRSYIRDSAPLQSIRDCPEVKFWRGQNFYSFYPKYFPVESGPAHSILKVVGRGPYNCCSINEWRLYPYIPNVFLQDINLSDIQLDFHQHARLFSNVFPSFSYNNISLDIIARSLVDFYPSDSSSPLSIVNDATYINQLFVVMDTQRVILPLLDSIVDHVARCGEIQQTHDEIQLVSDIKNHLLRYHSARLGRENIHAFSYHLHNLVVNHPPRCLHTSPKLYLLNHFLSVVSSPSFSSKDWLFSSILFRKYAPFF